ncbi:hypothetical protein [Streptomyces sp. NPDC002588]|uniref:hypothetical protein n=1 Tax=Streptomyces sp. NPDC002588 TaxID=3154419 RepID=UPI00331A118A
MTLSELAVQMGCELSNAILPLDKLEEQGFVERRVLVLATYSPVVTLGGSPAPWAAIS